MLLPTSSVRAATILWDTPQSISADTDVSTTGSRLYAYTFGNDAGFGADSDGHAGIKVIEPAGVPSTTVNGVNFDSFAVPYETSVTVIVDDVSLATSAPFFSVNNLAGSESAPFVGLSADYQGLLSSGVSTLLGNSTLTLTLGRLTDGQDYLVQFWSNDSHLLTNKLNGTIYTAGNSVTLDNNNPTNSEGGLGQWVTWSFTASGDTQVITIRSSVLTGDYPALNAFQVRTVPEPSSALLLLSGAALLLRRSRATTNSPPK